MPRLRSLIVVATGAIVAVVVLSQRFDEHSATSQPTHPEHDDSGHAESGTVLETRQADNRASTANDRDLPRTTDIENGVNPEFAAHLVWLRSRGYFGSDDLELYAAYDISALEELSAGGDLLASYALYYKHLQAYDLESARAAAYEGVLHGSTRNISIVANEYLAEALSPSDEQPDTSRANWIRALAWYEVAGIRGDTDMYEHGRDVAVREGVELTVEERGEVLALAQDFYNKLEQERRERGMVPYDNTPANPAIVYPDP